MTAPTTIPCPNCGYPVSIHYEQPDPDNPYEHGEAVCPNCGLERCAGMGCWCNFADGTWWRARTPWPPCRHRRPPRPPTPYPPP